MEWRSKWNECRSWNGWRWLNGMGLWNGWRSKWNEYQRLTWEVGGGLNGTIDMKVNIALKVNIVLVALHLLFAMCLVERGGACRHKQIISRLDACRIRVYVMSEQGEK
eukprot:1037683-Pelagomonas_calceolata.AAC.3